MGRSFPCLLVGDKFRGQWTLHGSEGLSFVGTVSPASLRDLPDQAQSPLNFNDGTVESVPLQALRCIHATYAILSMWFD